MLPEQEPSHPTEQFLLKDKITLAMRPLIDHVRSFPSPKEAMYSTLSPASHPTWGANAANVAYALARGAGLNQELAVGASLIPIIGLATIYYLSVRQRLP